MSSTGCGTIKKDGAGVEIDPNDGRKTIKVDLEDGRTIKNNWDHEWGCKNGKKFDKLFDKRLASAKNNEGKKVCWSTWDEKRFPIDGWFDCIWECKEK